MEWINLTQDEEKW